MTQIGQPTRLIEGRPKVQGVLRFGPDIKRPGMLYAKLVTSPYAHARVTGIDATEARALPGVEAVLTADDLPALEATSRAQLLLARNHVLFAGHPVALVLGESEAAAQDGAELVQVEYEPLEAVTGLEAALADDAQPVWPEGRPGQSAEAAAHGAGDAGDAATGGAGSPNIATRVEFPRGDLEAGFDQADVVVEREFHTSAVHQAYLEPHVATVEPEPTGSGMTVWTSTQATFYVRDSVAAALGVGSSDVKVVGTPVGGGFGGKFLLYEPLLALASRQIGRPIQHTLSRYEEMVAANPAPATRIRLKVGAKKDGRLVALDAELVQDNGCFPSSMSVLAGVLLGSLYKVPNQRVVGIEVLTHKASTGAYRAPLAPQSAFALESVLDEVARQLDLDPMELRLQNASGEGDPMAMGNPWPTMGMRQVLEALAAHPAWTGREEARKAGRGVGIAVGGWPGGTEPAAAACSLESDGTVHVHIGSVDLTGTNTTLAMLAAEAYGVEPERVKIQTGDTASSPFAGSTGGSKIVYTMGPAVMQAAEEARRQTLDLAAASLEADPADLEIRDGKVQVKGAPDKAIPLAKIAQRTMRYGSKQAPVFSHGRHAQPGPSPGFCAQLAEVEVDRDTGHVKVCRLVVVQDVGRALNPAAVEGQMMGGAVQGVGWALYEQMAYDESGQLQTATFSDYAVPHFEQAPEQIELVTVEVPSALGPLGARGVGEPPVIPTAAAIANAIADATGVRLVELPMSPPRVRSALAE